MTTIVKMLKGVAIVTAMLAPLVSAAHAQDYEGDPAYHRPMDDGDQRFRRRHDDRDQGDQGRDNGPRRHRGDDAADIAAGVIGGLAGSGAANAYGSGCHFERRPVLNEDGDVIGRRRVRVCD
ncbi:hypothetical protein M8523_31425 [Hyphomicrobiales bacterium BP6-180914]|uniref:Uncharacterized protein n=1 Tax=Lichenifustis flavocetrariae TaxID=2949735 RepID=A0AA41Z2B4_9HYPH|nr:hypothetical protein [Lichenifustis flavocetrariae]